jgi:hypothetical protein
MTSSMPAPRLWPLAVPLLQLMAPAVLLDA